MNLFLKIPGVLDRVSRKERGSTIFSASVSRMAVAAVEFAVKYSFVSKEMQTRRKGQYDADQFRYINIQPKTIDLSARLLGINPTNSVFIPTSLVLRSIVLG